MTIPRKALCVVYALIGIAALIGCWANNIDYLGGGFAAANVRFWQDTLVNPASRSITIDLLFLGLAAITWMLLEARRLSMRGVWLYVLAGAFIAISVAFPAFLVHRELTLARRDGSTSAGALSATDVLGVALVGLLVLAYAFVALGK
jgi:Protein of unknown function DUF2834